MTTPRALLAIIGGGTMARAIILGAMDAKLLSPTEIVVVERDAAKRKQFSSWGIGVTADMGEAVRSLVPPPGMKPREAMTKADREVRNLGGEAMGRGKKIAGHESGTLPEDAAALIAALNDRGSGSDSDSGEGLASHGGQILLAVKPQSLPEVAQQLRAPLAERAGRAENVAAPVVMSILAGTPIAKIRAALSSDASSPLPVVRIMPNTPARLRKSMTAISAGSGVSISQTQFAFDLFTSLGEVVKINEELMDAFTALAGSGPAYVFYLAEAMLNAAQDVGFDRITADRIVRQTISGASALLSESNEPPETLRAAVTSTGGTTEAACRTLDDLGAMEAVVRAVQAGRDRGRELAG